MEPERLSLERPWIPTNVYDLFFTPEGTVLVVLILSGILIFLRFVVGATDEISPEIRQEWESHHKRFKTKDAAEYLRGSAEDTGAIKLKRQILLDTPREVIEIPTNLGICRVTRIGHDRAKISIVTLHDVGTNWHHCFTNLQRELIDSNFFETFTFYHVNMVGHEEHAKYDPNSSVFSLESLAQQVYSVVDELKLSYFVGIGVGAGANVLLRYASIHPTQLRGLILVNPSIHAPNSSEKSVLAKLANHVSNSSNSSKGSGRWETTADLLAKFHFTRGYLESNPRIRDSICVSLQNMNHHAVKKYLTAAVERDVIDRPRLEALVDIPMLCVVGGLERGSWIGSRTANSADIQYLQSIVGERMCNVIDDGNLSNIPTEEDPANLALGIKVFLEQI